MSIECQIPKKVKDKIDSDIAEKMNSLADTYHTKDPNKLYESLKQLRYITTQHQLNVWQSYNALNFSQHLVGHK